MSHGGESEAKSTPLKDASRLLTEFAEAICRVPAGWEWVADHMQASTRTNDHPS